MRARRKALNLTQRELALAAGLGRIAVMRLENEPHKVHLQTALRVARVLGLRIGTDDEAAPAPDRAAGYAPISFDEAAE